MPIEVIQVDAFASAPFRGNPAAVCILPGPTRDDWMQAVAAEMNLSETAFLRKKSGGFSVRYFTPRLEVPLCGHATLASAHVLWENGIVSRNEAIRFQTRDAILFARREAGWICIDMPSYPVSPVSVPAGLADALGTSVLAAYHGAMDWYLIELRDESAVRALQPDFEELEQGGYGGVIVTAPGGASRSDFVSRYFAPAEGIPEDPVTGSSHCSLGPFWTSRLGKNELTGYQASRRGGTVRVRVRGDRVDVMGEAITVLRGTLTIDVPR